MAKNVKINSVVYAEVPQVSIPLAEGEGAATFYDTTGGDCSICGYPEWENCILGNRFSDRRYAR